MRENDLEKMLVTPMEAAKMMSLGKNSVYGLIRNGELRHISYNPDGKRPTYGVVVEGIKEWIARNEKGGSNCHECS